MDNSVQNVDLERPGSYRYSLIQRLQVTLEARKRLSSKTDQTDRDDQIYLKDNMEGQIAAIIAEELGRQNGNKQVLVEARALIMNECEQKGLDQQAEQVYLAILELALCKTTTKKEPKRDSTNVVGDKIGSVYSKVQKIDTHLL